MTELMALYIIIGILTVITLLLMSVLKGIAGTMDQRKEIFAKQIEWMNDIYNFIYKPIDEQDQIPAGNEIPETNYQQLFDEGAEKMLKKSKE